jgi:hypothetical protein
MFLVGDLYSYCPSSVLGVMGAMGVMVYPSLSSYPSDPAWSHDHSLAKSCLVGCDVALGGVACGRVSDIADLFSPP